MSLLKGEGTGVPEGNVAGVVRLGLPPSWHWLHASQSGLRASSGPSHMPTEQRSSHAVAEGVGAGVPEGLGTGVAEGVVPGCVEVVGTGVVEVPGVPGVGDGVTPGVGYSLAATSTNVRTSE